MLTFKSKIKMNKNFKILAYLHVMNKQYLVLALWLDFQECGFPYHAVVAQSLLFKYSNHNMGYQKNLAVTKKLQDLVYMKLIHIVKKLYKQKIKQK